MQSGIQRILQLNLQKTLYRYFFKMPTNPVEDLIRVKLTTELNPSYLGIINESYMHNVPKGAETHFKVVIVSDKFNGTTRIKRHRMVNDILKDELQGAIHALSIIAETPDKFEPNKIVEPSPKCLGGFGK